MLRNLFVFTLVGVVAVGLLWAAPDKVVHKQKMDQNLPVFGTSNDPDITVGVAPDRPTSQHLDDYVGTIDTAGTTWYDYQHNGTAGKMISADDFGMVSVVWMNGLNAQQNPRYVYYNVWDPVTSDFMYTNIGIRIDASTRAGYISQVTSPDGFCFPAFHQQTTGDNAHATSAIDYCAYCEAFTVVEPAWCFDGGTDLELIWPKIDMDINGVLHMVSCENPASGAAGDPQRIYYSRGVPEFDQDGFGLDILWDELTCSGFNEVEYVMVIAPDVACSRHTERVAIAWCHSMDDLADASQINNEIYMMVSEDGGLNWGDFINVTQWTPWDPVCLDEGGDPYECDRDTFRVYTDCSILMDEDDYIHVAFTTPAFFWYVDNGGVIDSGWYSYSTNSMIWHWNEQTHYSSLVANGWQPAYEPGAWQRTTQRPSLAVDPSTNYLYCSYQKYDTLAYSESSGIPLADAWVSMSTNNGCSWSLGTNVTNTTPPMEIVPSGESLHERDITVAKLVTGGYLHMEYVLDKDAGGVPQEEGLATLNPVIYQRIPVADIPALPYTERYPMHWDSVGLPPDECYLSGSVETHALPERFALYQNYPNPFNPTTMIQFDMGQRAKVTLKVYNVLGQEVANLLSDVTLTAGTHNIAFDGSELASGIYIYSLISDGYVASKKMVLMK